MQFLSNPDLHTIKPDRPWTAHDDGHFCASKQNSFWKTIKWIRKWHRGDDGSRVKYIPMTMPRSWYTRLGHSTFIFVHNSKTFITDPVFYSIPFVHRISSMPIRPKDIVGVDYILISHDHRDHLDQSSLKLLCRNNPRAQILCGLWVKKLISWRVKNPIQEAWRYQQYDTDQSIIFLPSTHRARRWLWDTNTRLWWSFAIDGIYFGWDSAYWSHFTDIWECLKIHHAFLGVGACEPRRFMKDAHMNVDDALQAAKDMKAEHIIPMHFGTFRLWDDTVKSVQKACANAGIAPCVIWKNYQRSNVWLG